MMGGGGADSLDWVGGKKQKINMERQKKEKKGGDAFRCIGEKEKR